MPNWSRTKRTAHTLPPTAMDDSRIQLRAPAVAGSAAARPAVGRAAAAPELTIVVPTFNEAHNVAPLVGLLKQALAGVDWEVIFVDDDSPDGTADMVRTLARENPRLRIIQRIGRRGLSGAVIEGMLSSVSPLVAVMDADLQHDEARLSEMLARMRADPDLDIVIASRNLDGGSGEAGLGTLRHRGSLLATAMTRRLLGNATTDPMSGFFMMRRERFIQIVPQLQHEGFKLLADILSVSGGKWRLAEIPYIFRRRQHGASKMGLVVVLQFLALLATRRSGGLLSLRFALYLLVGASGVLVQLATLRLMLWTVTDAFVVAQIIGVLAAMTSNFLLNNAITYSDRRLRGMAQLRGLLSFYLICSLGAIANVGVAGAVFRVVPQPEIASLSGAAVGAVWNFLASAVFTWRAR